MQQQQNSSEWHDVRSRRAAPGARVPPYRAPGSGSASGLSYTSVLRASAGGMEAGYEGRRAVGGHDRVYEGRPDPRFEPAGNVLHYPPGPVALPTPSYTASSYTASSYTIAAPTEPSVTVPLSMVDAASPSVFIPYVHTSQGEAEIAAALEAVWGKVRSVTIKPRMPRDGGFQQHHYTGPANKAYVHMESWYASQPAQEARFHLLSGAFVKLFTGAGGEHKAHFLGCLMNRSPLAASARTTSAPLVRGGGAAAVAGGAAAVAGGAAQEDGYIEVPAGEEGLDEEDGEAGGSDAPRRG
jgi:hypothetical protein